ncbi:MAG TPA: hydroxymethylbilane synthase [Ktedonobacterales bacterium]
MTTEIARIGTRGSALALWQADHVRELLQDAWPGLTVEIEIITTHGDKILDTPLPQIGGKGVFTEELEAALRAGSIDLAVHSLKDLPTDPSPGLIVGAVPAREDPRDALVSRGGHTLARLPAGATVGTSSVRRSAQLMRARPDLRLVDLRGNVDTRIRKAQAPSGPYDAIVLARAGLVRLGRDEVISEILPIETLLPAPGQGALGIQCRDDAESRRLLAPLMHAETAMAVTAERAFLAGLGGGCATPVGAYAVVEGDRLLLHGRVCAPDGSRQVDVSLQASASPKDALTLGEQLARQALAAGAQALFEAHP